jgi:hypothetical protein
MIRLAGFVEDHSAVLGREREEREGRKEAREQRVELPSGAATSIDRERMEMRFQVLAPKEGRQSSGRLQDEGEGAVPWLRRSCLRREH